MMRLEKMYGLLRYALVAGVLFVPSLANAAGDGHVELPKQDWGSNGVFGTYDKASLQRGFKIYREVCAACHGMKHLYYRNLTGIGYNENQVKNIASQYTVTDGPDDEGEMFDRSAIPSDPFVSPYPNEKAASATNNGAIPPDLSLIVKARHGGPDYVYGLLTGYEEPAHGVSLGANQHYNKYKLGHIIAMAPPLSDGMVAYEDGSPKVLSQYAKDVSHFLQWASDPYMEERKRIGLRVVLFLMAFAALMYAVKRRVWADVH